MSDGSIGSIRQAILRSDKYFTDCEMTYLQSAIGSTVLKQEGLQEWQMSDGRMDRSDPLDKQSYGRTNILQIVK